MTDLLDKARALEAQLRADDGLLPGAPWAKTNDVRRADVTVALPSGDVAVLARVNITDDDATDQEHFLAAAVARTRNAIPAIADALRDLRAEVEDREGWREMCATNEGTIRRLTAHRDAVLDQMNAWRKQAEDNMAAVCRNAAERDGTRIVNDALACRIEDVTTERDAALASVKELEAEVAGWRRKAEVSLKLFGETQREAEEMRPVVAAAVAYATDDSIPDSGLLDDAVDAYRARKP